jgi:hypothetical protein
MTADTTEFWIADEPVRYRVRKTDASDLREAGVLIVRTTDAEGNDQQALLEFQYDGDQLRLAQVDGDLDAKRMIAADQRSGCTSIWRRIWKVAMS